MKLRLASNYQYKVLHTSTTNHQYVHEQSDAVKLEITFAASA